MFCFRGGDDLNRMQLLLNSGVFDSLSSTSLCSAGAVFVVSVLAF